ncbi:MAG: dihydropteroate synthase [Candidatus Amulumruptor caecigallinarius]|nr:dihydropteroate synthase [Candidatus Amulumruptor caecigallinarius]MCM1396754.1 dihydropteroate synthase [Candidatus Amulumruptor caecigallinarius]MCM1453188.1 dihydropteroate synthase [bacterium]
MSTCLFKAFTINVKGRLLRFERPAVMGIVNLTPDSFFAGSRTLRREDVEKRVEALVASGADMLDVGACSTRPGAEVVAPDEELRRLELGLEALRRVAPGIPVSVDTFRADVAREAVASLGADIINDISGLDGDPAMLATVAELRCPYVLMHMRGTPATMQALTDYTDGVVADVLETLSRKLRLLRLAGVNDVIVDPGFGFAKTVEQNYELLDALALLRDALDAPVLAGVSRKSMICRPLHITSDDALAATTAVNTMAILRGASILRVHDTREAAQAVELCSFLPSLSSQHTPHSH